MTDQQAQDWHDVDLSDLLAGMYRFGAAGPHEWDCWTAAAEIRRRAGLGTPTRQQVAEAVLAGSQLFERLPGPKPWCLVYFTVEPRHVGVVLPGGRAFFHITAQAGPAIADLADWPWRNKVEAYYEVAQ